MMIFHHKRAEQFDMIVHDLQAYLNSYFGELLTTVDKLQPLTLSPCASIASELTSRAAFSLNVRAFLLVENGLATCSSATGEMNIPMKQLVPQVDINKKLDIEILPGTPMLPQKAGFRPLGA